MVIICAHHDIHFGTEQLLHWRETFIRSSKENFPKRKEWLQKVHRTNFTGNSDNQWKPLWSRKFKSTNHCLPAQSSLLTASEFIAQRTLLKSALSILETTAYNLMTASLSSRTERPQPTLFFSYLTSPFIASHLFHSANKSPRWGRWKQKFRIFYSSHLPSEFSNSLDRMRWKEFLKIVLTNVENFDRLSTVYLSKTFTYTFTHRTDHITIWFHMIISILL